LEDAIENKTKHILENPKAFAPLHAPLEGKFHVHIMTSFVLIYSVDETRKVVRFLRFAHHDDAF
jgi:mRNA-degrading endonuclease RelE of RelBE toxin-antitoxin system